MKHIRKAWLLFVFAVLFLSGCNMQTIDEMYCLPRRSEAYANLQIAIDNVMTDLEYSAPVSGEYRQTVQMADLDGDKKQEYMLFAKGATDKPLHIFIFAKEKENFVLMDRIECSGTDFDQIEYIRLNEAPGFELVVGRQISNQVLRSVSVFTMVDGQMQQMMAVNYHKFICSDLNEDGLTDIFVLRPGENELDSGVAEYYQYTNGTIVRSVQSMSNPVSKLKRVLIGMLGDGVTAAFVASEADDSTIQTDIFSVVYDSFTNIALTNDSGMTINTLRAYDLYAEDIDDDGVVEIPNVVSKKLPSGAAQNRKQYFIRWFSVYSDGYIEDKLNTYYNTDSGWYLELPDTLSSDYSVEQIDNRFEFSIWNRNFTHADKVLTVFVLPGSFPEGESVLGDLFILKNTGSMVYAARLEEEAPAYLITVDKIKEDFHLIQQQWYTGEMT